VNVIVLSAIFFFCIGAEHVNAVSYNLQPDYTTAQEINYYLNKVEGFSYEGTSEPETTDSKRQLCLFWGLIGNCGFKASATIETSLDTKEESQGEKAERHEEVLHEYRSILWGAVRWSTRDREDEPVDNDLDISQ
jgi:hypothetical protein